MLWDDMTTANGTISGTGSGRPGGDDASLGRCGLVLCCWLAAAALGAIHTWAARHNMNADGMSYLDLADAWREGRWAEAINAYWSPLYSWLLAVSLDCAVRRHTGRPPSLTW